MIIDKSDSKKLTGKSGENQMKKCYEHVVKEVLPDSIAEEMEIEPGDVLLSINDRR